MRLAVAKLCFAMCAAVTVAACGPASKPKDGANAIGIFTSAQDCAEVNKATLEECKTAINDALAAHEQLKHFISDRLCEIDAGPGRCERIGQDKFRPRLAAFLVEFSKPPRAEPLYAPKKTDVTGYVTANNAKTYLTIDETLIVTPAAKQIAYTFTDQRAF